MKIDIPKLMDYLLPEPWQKECQLIWKGGLLFIKHQMKGREDAYLRYSEGPKTGSMWDVYGDSFMSNELAVLEIYKAPAPPRNNGELGILGFTIPLNEKDDIKKKGGEKIDIETIKTLVLVEGYKIVMINSTTLKLIHERGDKITLKPSKEDWAEFYNWIDNLIKPEVNIKEPGDSMTLTQSVNQNE